MAFTPHTILITGGGTGIGLGLAEALQKRGVKVIIGGRRKDVLEKVCAANPGMEYVILDVASPDSITKTRDELLAKHPEIDAVMNNAGVQRPFDFAAEKPVELGFADNEIDINIRGLFNMCAAWLPHLKTKEAAYIINVSSGLAFVPLARVPSYCATKAAVHSFTVSLREQLRGSPVRIIECEPPAVQTELHDYMGAERGRAVGIPLAEFVSETMESFDAGTDDFAVAQAKNLAAVVDSERFAKTLEMLNAMHL
ncbi:hypothetical protein WJX81_008156 [Elliptochloris bilobata]|uniref:Ketoreductase domain-containing protein n=1 Tax=Elliptochloris bilobata TaxID=381761 RepID=A0AAW1RG94_9CHLO